jgi:beta,beta-carotene 9',10'-dioxygenase
LLRNEPFIRNYRWEPERGSRFHVFDKDDGRRVTTAEGEPFFAFHHVNAYEAGGDLLVDVVAYPDASIIDQLYLARLRAAEPIERLLYSHATSSVSKAQAIGQQRNGFRIPALSCHA